MKQSFIPIKIKKEIVHDIVVKHPSKNHAEMTDRIRGLIPELTKEL